MTGRKIGLIDITPPVLRGLDEALLGFTEWYRGIGAEVCRAFAEAGDRVAVHCGHPVTYANDASAAGYGEFWVGSGREATASTAASVSSSQPLP